MAHTIKARRWAIEKLKDEAGIRTDEDLAARCGVSPKTVQRAKNGEDVSPRLIAGLWAAFGKAATEEALYTVEAGK